MDERGQVSVELLLVMGVALVVAVAFLSQVQDNARQMGGVLNGTVNRSLEIMNLTNY